MIDITHKGKRAVRHAARFLSPRIQSKGDTSLNVTLSSATWGPSGELRLVAVVRGGRPGRHLIGELRERGKWSLLGFAVQRSESSAEGTVVEGAVPPDTLALLSRGRHDLSITALADSQRRTMRVRADPALELPVPWKGFEVYVTNRGNVSLRREEKPASSPPVQVRPAGVDARAVTADLAGLTRALRTYLERTDALGACGLSFRFPDVDAVRFDHLFPGLDVDVLIKRSDARWQIAVLGRDHLSERFLRNVLVNRARMVVIDDEQLHRVAEVPAEEHPGDVVESIGAVLVDLLDRFRLFLDAGPRPREHGLVPAQWWDAKPNFGDVLGPMLIESLTGRSAINVRSFPSDDPGLFTVGSIAGHLKKPGSRIWGSGVIGELSGTKAATLAERTPKSIHAVRGAHTRRALQDVVGWHVPEVYGDPGLLLPRFYEPRPAPETQGKVAVVPHYMHRRLLPPELPDEVAVVDVRQGPEAVIDQIVSARACISSSLHGLVVAQAWDVPWARLKVADVRLHGTDFKFEDFYTVLDRDAVSTVQLTEEQFAGYNWTEASMLARVPATRFDAERLLSAFPEG